MFIYKSVVAALFSTDSELLGTDLLISISVWRRDAGTTEEMMRRFCVSVFCGAVYKRAIFAQACLISSGDSVASCK